jgi:DNA-binding NarL/FixJ family response regulator
MNINGKPIYFTPKEKQCLELLDQGHTFKGIGQKLLITPKTVETHINNIKQKTGYHYRYDLIKTYRDSLT